MQAFFGRPCHAGCVAVWAAHNGCAGLAQGGVQRLYGTLPESLGCALIAGAARRAPGVPVAQYALPPLAAAAQGAQPAAEAIRERAGRFHRAVWLPWHLLHTR